MDNPTGREENPKSKARKIFEWITGRVPAQVTITPTLAITVTFTISVTLAMSVYAFIDIIFQDTGWEVAGAQASTAYSVLISQDVVIEETLEVQKDLRIQDDLQILGSVIDMAGSSCDSEGVSPDNTVRVCFEDADSTLKVSENGGPYLAVLTEAWFRDSPFAGGGQAGLPGQDGTSCWDLNGDGAPGREEDLNRDSRVDVLDCRGTPGVAGQDGLNCWDTNGNRQPDLLEDVNGDRQVDARDCQGTPLAMHGLIDLPVRQSCGEVVVSPDILNTLGNNASLLSVQLTPRSRWWPLYTDVKLPSVFICQPDLTGGTVDYYITVAR